MLWSVWRTRSIRRPASPMLCKASPKPKFLRLPQQQGQALVALWLLQNGAQMSVWISTRESRWLECQWLISILAMSHLAAQTNMLFYSCSKPTMLHIRYNHHPRHKLFTPCRIEATAAIVREPNLEIVVTKTGAVWVVNRKPEPVDLTAGELFGFNVGSFIEVAPGLLHRPKTTLVVCSTNLYHSFSYCSALIASYP